MLRPLLQRLVLGLVDLVRAFRLTILAQVALLAVGWLVRHEILAWWLSPLAHASSYEASVPSSAVELKVVLLATWVVLMPLAASDAWRWGFRTAHTSVRGYHWYFGAACGLVGLAAALLARALAASIANSPLLMEAFTP